MRAFFAILFSLLLSGLWLVGLVASLWHPSRGPWRRYATAAFALLLSSRLLTTAYVANGVLDERFTWASQPTLVRIQDLLQVLGVALIILALVTGRTKRGVSPEPPPTRSPEQQDPRLAP
jgi:hypothetical protein